MKITKMHIGAIVLIIFILFNFAVFQEYMKVSQSSWMFVNICLIGVGGFFIFLFNKFVETPKGLEESLDVFKRFYGTTNVGKKLAKSATKDINLETIEMTRTDKYGRPDPKGKFNEGIIRHGDKFMFFRDASFMRKNPASITQFATDFAFQKRIVKSKVDRGEEIKELYYKPSEKARVKTEVKIKEKREAEPVVAG